MNLYVCSTCHLSIITADDQDVTYCDNCGGHVFKLDEEDIDEVGK